MVPLPPERALFILLGLGLAAGFGSAWYAYAPGALGGIVVVFLSLVALLYLQVRNLTVRPPQETAAAGGAGGARRRRGGRAVPR